MFPTFKAISDAFIEETATGVFLSTATSAIPTMTISPKELSADKVIFPKSLLPSKVKVTDP